MVKCNPDCPAVCDFCRYYNFNGKRVLSVDGKSSAMIYTGDGKCEHQGHLEPREPYERCDDFHCKHTREAEPD